MSKRLFAGVMLALLLIPSLGWACACGCGAFDVGTSSMMPTDSGGSVWLEYDYMNQYENFHNASRASKDENDDKQIRTDFITAGGQYMFNRSWGIQATVPYWVRHFKTTDDDTGGISHLSSNDFGDVHLQGVYSGFSEDMSTGITFGMKLPTGQFNAGGFDRDTQIGTGSTDILLGAYHMGALTDDMLFSWFVHGQIQHAVSIQDHYRPGDDFNAATGVIYNGLTFDNGSKLSPLFQVIGSRRQHDAGMNSDPDNTGYTRMLLSPGVEYVVDSVKLYGDVETPVYQNMKGDQLTAPVMFKFMVGYNF